MIHIENNIPTKGKTYESGNGFTYLRGSASANKQETRNLLALTLANILVVAVTSYGTSCRYMIDQTRHSGSIKNLNPVAVRVFDECQAFHLSCRFSKSQ